MPAIRFIKDWALIFSMVFGVASYFAYVNMSIFDCIRPFAMKAVSIVQPSLIFCMLFLTFCKVNPRNIRIYRWQLWLLLIQASLFIALGAVLAVLPNIDTRVVLEGAMICFICPTATAAAVVTRKLGGDITGVTTYTILINLLAAVLIPAMLPYVHPNPSLSTLNASFLILGKVFPLLLLPFFLAMLVRFLSRPLQEKLTKWQDAPFYLWVVSLSLAIAVTARSIVHSTVPLSTEIWLVGVSLFACVFQFWAGRKIGAAYSDKVTAGQALGQKNTVLAIWLGYTFFTPITSIAGGFYSIWHNVINTYQLYKHRKNSQYSKN